MKKEAPSNSFLSTLQRHRGGALLEDASVKLQELVASVATTGKGGSLTIKLNVKPASRGQSAVVVTDKIASVVPSIEPEASFWFATTEGSLQKDDPRQRQMPFAVEGGSQPEANQEQAPATAESR